MGCIRWKKMSKINGVKQVCCAMNDMKKMFNERWSGSMNYLYMKNKENIEHEYFMKKKTGSLYKQMK